MITKPSAEILERLPEINETLAAYVTETDSGSEVRLNTGGALAFIDGESEVKLIGYCNPVSDELLEWLNGHECPVFHMSEEKAMAVGLTKTARALLQ